MTLADVINLFQHHRTKKRDKVDVKAGKARQPYRIFAPPEWDLVGAKIKREGGGGGPSLVGG